MPTTDEIRRHWSALVGRPVTVQQGTTPASADNVASYIDDDGRVVAACLFDFPIAAALGSSLIMVPAGAARDAAKSRDIPESMAASFREVANITASLFARAGLRVKLREVATPSSQAPEDVQALLAAPRDRRDMTVTVETYDAGTISILLA